MKKYIYVGPANAMLPYGTTALGRLINGVFHVQVDEFENPWSHGWHKSGKEHWCERVEPNEGTGREGEEAGSDGPGRGRQ